MPPLARVLAVTVPVHAALPMVLLLPTRAEVLAALVLTGHLVGALALLATLRWWWGYGAELLVVLAIDHAVTFAVGAAIAG